MSYIDIDTIVASGGSHILQDDCEKVATDKMLRNSQIRLELQAKAKQQSEANSMKLVRIHQARILEPQRKRVAEFKAEEKAKRMPRAFAWILVLIGAYFLLRILGGGFDMTPDPLTPLAWLFWIWACIWCLWGIETIMWMSDSSFAVLILLWVIPFYICGPTLYLWDSYTMSRSIKRVEGIA